MRFWAQAQPREHLLRPLNVEKVTVWCAIGLYGIIGPYWFEDENGCPVTVNTKWYIEMMQRKFIPALRRKYGVDMNTVIYHQDGATLHTSNVSLEYLRHYFPRDRLILHHMDNPWPVHFPDLSPPDLFCWGYLKERVYHNSPQTIDALKEDICCEIRRIAHEMLDRVINNYNVRVTTVIQRWGAWIEHVINYWTTLRNGVVRKDNAIQNFHACVRCFRWKKWCGNYAVEMTGLQNCLHFIGPCCITLTLFYIKTTPTGDNWFISY